MSWEQLRTGILIGTAVVAVFSVTFILMTRLIPFEGPMTGPVDMQLKFYGFYDLEAGMTMDEVRSVLRDLKPTFDRQASEEDQQRGVATEWTYTLICGKYENGEPAWFFVSLLFDSNGRLIEASQTVPSGNVCRHDSENNARAGNRSGVMTFINTKNRPIWGRVF